ncbi:MAG: efflux RND transporter periplasmic adaptor subunit, partial [Rhodocyclaceae bacterium]|nr:efflux RND transporter periplasmic adaptor subunit [Rhodocyclaceae bacterium]
MSAKSTPAVAIVVVAVLAAGGGYWFGRGQEPAAPAPMAGEPGKAAGKKLLHYRNPMGLPDTSPVPKKDSMGMDYIPVYEGEDDAPAAGGDLKIATDKVQKTGLRTEAAAPRILDRVVRAAGRIEVDERRTHLVTPRFEGFVERLHVNTTGQAVGRGQPLFEVYSPELVSAQREYALAIKGVEAMKDASPESRAAMKELADAALLRLRNWDISEEQVAALARDGREQRTLSFLSPAAGIVTEKKVVQGQRFMPG